MRGRARLRAGRRRRGHRPRAAGPRLAGDGGRRPVTDATAARRAAELGVELVEAPTGPSLDRARRRRRAGGAEPRACPSATRSSRWPPAPGAGAQRDRPRLRVGAGPRRRAAADAGRHRHRRQDHDHAAGHGHARGRRTCAAVAAGNTDMPLVDAPSTLDVDAFVVECTSFRLAWTDALPDRGGGVAQPRARPPRLARLDGRLRAGQGRICGPPAAGRRGDRQRRRPGRDGPTCATAPGRHVTFGDRAADYRVEGGRLPRPAGRVAERRDDAPRPAPRRHQRARRGGAGARGGRWRRWPASPRRWPAFERAAHRIELVGDGRRRRVVRRLEGHHAPRRAHGHPRLRPRRADRRRPQQGPRPGRAGRRADARARRRRHRRGGADEVADGVRRRAARSSRADVDGRRRRARPRGSPPPATPCCCRRRAPASTGTRATPSAATTSPALVHDHIGA